MSWTDERIDTLRRLWDEGHSASRIAGQLGIVSRNAVIGKVHRLGLSARAKPAAVAAAEARTRSLREAALGIAADGYGAILPDGAGDALAAALAPDAAPTAVPDTSPADEASRLPLAADSIVLNRTPATPTVPQDLAPAMAPAPTAPRAAEVALPESRRIGIMDLREDTCRWPLGDPLRPGFGFCGARCAPAGTYCTDHAQLAYQPSLERRRDRLPTRV